jgi:hypothetical protein
MALQTFTAGQVLTAAQLTSLQANDYNQTVSAKTTSYTLVAADKGTRITMSSASATTITVNTGLFTAGDSLRIQNLNGGGSCTITAGTATVTAVGPLVLPSWAGGQLYFTSASAAVWFPDYFTTSSATVATSQTTTSSTFTDLATPGPAVTLTTGTSALVIISCMIQTTAGNAVYAGFTVSGATTTAASTTSALKAYSSGGLLGTAQTLVCLVTLTAGSNTFTMKYGNVQATETGTYNARTITVIPL